MRRKICILTGTRADYGLLYPLLKRLRNDDVFDLQIIVTGMHLSHEFGMTYKEIENDGFVIDEMVEMLLSSDTEVGISKSISIAIASFADVFKRARPDMLIVLGDRFEIFAAALSAYIARIPITHLHGGELTEGAIDDALRHSITKMSFLHFTSTEEYRRRVIQLGETPERVFNVGALGVDNIIGTRLLSKKELEQQMNFEFNMKTALVTYHPVTLENKTSKEQFYALLNALDDFADLRVIFTKPNADANGREIIRLIEDYTRRTSGKAWVYTSLGRMKYLSSMKYVDVVIGNSSSGIIETPSFQKPTLNIGDRQKGRIKSENIIDCKPEKEDIKTAIEKALSDNFQKICKKVISPYGEGSTSKKIVEILKKELSKKISLKKAFFDIKGPVMNEMHSKDYSEKGDTNGKKRSIHC